MCYFTNNFYSDYNLREEMQQKIANGRLDKEFYNKLYQTLITTEKRYLNQKTRFYDIQMSLRKMLFSYLILLNKDISLNVNIGECNNVYLTNLFLFELTFCENFCKIYKNSINKDITIKANFSDNLVTITIKYKGKKINIKNHCKNLFILNKSIFSVNKLTFILKTNSIKGKKPSKIDGYIKNRLSCVYLSLNLYNLKVFN